MCAPLVPRPPDQPLLAPAQHECSLCFETVPDQLEWGLLDGGDCVSGLHAVSPRQPGMVWPQAEARRCSEWSNERTLTRRTSPQDEEGTSRCNSAQKTGGLSRVVPHREELPLSPGLQVLSWLCHSDAPPRLYQVPPVSGSLMREGQSRNESRNSLCLCPFTIFSKPVS